jgi:hypothetical protein
VAAIQSTGRDAILRGSGGSDGMLKSNSRGLTAKSLGRRCRVHSRDILRFGIRQSQRLGSNGSGFCESDHC